MNEIDSSRPDRDVGSMLSGEEVERLREAIGWLRGQRGLTLKDIALGCDAAEHTVRNFAHRKSIRPDNAFLGKLYKFITGRKELLPDDFFPNGEEPHTQGRQEFTGRLGRFDLVRMELPISEDDLNRIFERYSGFYLCFRRSYRPDKLSVSWLHILPLSPNLDVAKESLPIPRFTLFIKYPDAIDPDTRRSYIIVGYVLRRNGRIYLIGQNDGDLMYFTVKEPSNRRFTYMQGLSLLTSAEDGEPFATRIVCQYLGKSAAREDWDGKIGVFPDATFHDQFDNADIIKRAIGDGRVLTGNDSD
jgi:hypothetical protein